MTRDVTFGVVGWGRDVAQRRGAPFTQQAACDVTLEWSAATESSAEWFNLYRGDSGSLAAGNYGTCLQHDLPTNTTTDTDRPPAGVAWTYLVTGEGAGGEGTPGQQPDGAPRVLTTPCP